MRRIRAKEAGAPVMEGAMRRPIQLLLIALLVVLIVAVAAGCGANREVVRSEGPKVEVHLPPAEVLDVRLRGQGLPQAPPSAPLSVSDESRGRWLTLFQMNVTPSEAAGVPPGPPESP